MRTYLCLLRVIFDHFFTQWPCIPTKLGSPQTRRKNDELFHCFYRHCRPKELDVYFPYNSGKKYQNCGNFCARGDKKSIFFLLTGTNCFSGTFTPPPQPKMFFGYYITLIAHPQPPQDFPGNPVSNLAFLKNRFFTPVTLFINEISWKFLRTILNRWQMSKKKFEVLTSKLMALSQKIC